jgi:hypothetical protein
MADNEGGGSGFTGLIAGLLIAALLVGGGLYLYNSGNLGQRTAEINVTVPDADGGG